MTLRFRLALFIAIAIAAALLTQGVLGYLSFYRLLLSDLDRDLSVYLSQIIGQLQSRQDENYQKINVVYENYVTRARIVRGQQVLVEWGNFPKEIPLSERGTRSFGNWRVSSVQISSSSYLQGAIYSQELALGLKDYRQTLIFTVLLVSLLGALTAVFLSNRALNPLRDLLETAKKIAHSGDLSLRVPQRRGGELGELSQTFNHMMERLMAFRRREAEFTRNASHELRTPLGAMRLQLSAYREGYAAAEETLYIMDEEVERMTRLSESLLTLAREGDTLKTRLDLAEITQEVAQKTQTPYQGSPHLMLYGDPALLRQALLNLIHNARKHAPDADRWISLEAQEEFAVLSVSDLGPGMPPEALQRASEAFYRAPGTRVPGSGLGLNVVERVAQAHGGKLELLPNQPQGLVARLWVRLPEAPA